MKQSIYFFFILLGWLMTSCDGTGTIKDPNATHFIRYYGRDGDQTGVDFVRLPDGSSILFGTTTPSDNGSTSNWYLVKIDAKGMVIWEKEVGVPNVNETASDIELTANGFVAVGNYYTSATDGDVLIKTFSLDGDELKSYRKVKPGSDENAASVSVTSDGFIVVGSTSDVAIKGGPTPPVTDTRDVLHARFDNNLVEFSSAWAQTTGFAGADIGVKVFEVSPGLFYVFGYSSSPTPTPHPRNDYNFFYFSLNNTGTYQGIIAYGPNDDERLGSVAQASSGYIFCGITTNPAGTSDVYVQKIRRNPAFIENEASAFFAKPLSIGLGLNVPERTSIVESVNGGFYLLTNERSVADNQNWMLTKMGSDGSLAWTIPIVYGGEGPDSIGAIQELPDGRLFIIGTMKTGKPDTGETKMTLLKVNSEGKFIE